MSAVCQAWSPSFSGIPPSADGKRRPLRRRDTALSEVLHLGRSWDFNPGWSLRSPDSAPTPHCLSVRTDPKVKPSFPCPFLCHLVWSSVLPAVKLGQKQPVHPLQKEMLLLSESAWLRKLYYTRGAVCESPTRAGLCPSCLPSSLLMTGNFRVWSSWSTTKLQGAWSTLLAV